MNGCIKDKNAEFRISSTTYFSELHFLGILEHILLRENQNSVKYA